MFMAGDNDVDSLSPRLPPTTLSHEPFGAVISWNAATTVLITTVVGPGITNGDQPHRGNSKGCLKPDRGLFETL